MRVKLIVKTLVFLLVFSGTLIIAQNTPSAPPTVPEPVVIGERGVFRTYFKMSEKEEQEALENLTPELRTQFKLIKENDESRYYELLREYSFRGTSFARVWSRFGEKNEDESNEVLEYEIGVEALAAKYKKANSGDKDKIKADLERNLSYLFDLKEKSREEEVLELEARLNELKKKMNMRKKNKTEIISRRIEELLGEDKYLEWE